MTGPVPLAEAGDGHRFGGKAKGLARAVRAGLPVPPGVALAVDTVEVLVHDGGASGALDGLVERLGGSVAVRSSGVGEDDQEASFAGQHATLLNVRTHAGLVHAVREVYQSAHSASALAYRERMGMPVEPRIAVVIQQLVAADTAGVLFTHNPATGASERLVEAAWGLGEAVVSGIVIPDAFRLTDQGAVVERSVGVKDVALRPGAQGGIEEVEVEAHRVHAPCLDDGELQALHALTLSCEAVYGHRLDIEWAFARGRLYLLQCRAITR